MFGIAGKSLSQPNGFQMPDMATVQPMSGYQLPSGGPNLGQPIPTADQPLPMSPPMNIPSGGPNMRSPLPNAPTSDPFAKISMSGYTPPPMDAATAIACGIPPSQVMNPNSSAFGPTQAPTIGGFMDIFNRPPAGMQQPTQMPVQEPAMTPMPNMTGYGAPPQPMAQPQQSMMPMKGMFGVR